MPKIATAALFAVILLAGCAGQPTVADIGQDKVVIQGNNAPQEQIAAKASESCAMYQRVAKPMSYRCGDGYCIQKLYLFACLPPEARQPQVFDPAPAKS